VTLARRQPWHAFKETGVLNLAWAGDGHAIVDAFARHGLPVEWGGTPGRCTTVDFCGKGAPARR